MSAKNWRRCPRCVRRAEDEVRRKVAEAKAAYGVVPHARFLQLNAEAANPPALRDTLREDHRIGVGEDGKFYVRYECNCEACGFGYEYKFETRAEPGKD